MTEKPAGASASSHPLTLAEWKASRPKISDVNEEHEASIKGLEKLAVAVTDKVGTMGFFLVILCWTILWCGYNILATEVKPLHLHPFDPFPSFVAYLLISNVIQILLMPLIMVGQNLQGRHSELRAEHDLAVNVKAEKEIELVLAHLEQQQNILAQLVKAQGIKLDAVLDLEAAELKVRTQEVEALKTDPASLQAQKA